MRARQTMRPVAMAAVLLLSACAELGMGGDPVYPVTGGLEIWNRTEEPVLTGSTMATMGDAGLPRGGRPRPLYILFTAEVGGIETPDEPPSELPTCEGRPQVQEGV